MHVFAAAMQLRMASGSLKVKRGIVKSILSRARNNFNVAAAEVGLQDVHGAALLAFVSVAESRAGARRILEQVEDRIADERPDVEIVSFDIEER